MKLLVTYLTRNDCYDPPKLDIEKVKIHYKDLHFPGGGIVGDFTQAIKVARETGFRPSTNVWVPPAAIIEMKEID